MMSTSLSQSFSILANPNVLADLVISSAKQKNQKTIVNMASTLAHTYTMTIRKKRQR
jgi:hypothetical protein